MQSTYQSQSFLLCQMTATTVKPVRNGYQNKFDLYSSKHIHSFKTIIREREKRESTFVVLLKYEDIDGRRRSIIILHRPLSHDIFTGVEWVINV